MLTYPPEQDGHLEFEELRRALVSLPDDQREALVLIGAAGFSYEEAAQICSCAVGTIKSRVNRAPTRLADLMSIETMNDFAQDKSAMTALSGSSRQSHEAA